MPVCRSVWRTGWRWASEEIGNVRLPIGDLKLEAHPQNQSAIGDRQSPIRSVLVIKPSSLGDVVHTLPAVARLKRAFPMAHLSWLVNPEWAPLLEGNPYVDEVIHFPRRELSGLRGILRAYPWARALNRRTQAELVLDFQGLLRSALIAWNCRAANGRVVGLSDAREGARFFYDEAAEMQGVAHAVDRYLALVRHLGIDTDAALEWPLPAGDPVEGISGGYVLLHPFSRGSGKSLTPAQVAEFCETLAPRRVVIAGRSSEALPPIANAVNLLNETSLAQLIWLIRHSDFVVSVDSGPMHIAAAITSRLLSIHTWSDPRLVGPYRGEAWVWKDSALYQVRASGDHQPAADVHAIAEWVKRAVS